MNQSLFYSPSFLLEESKQTKLLELVEILKSKNFQIINQSSELADLKELPETLVCSFVADLQFLNLKAEVLKELSLNQVFELVKKFVQARIRKKSGNLIFLVNSEIDGFSYSNFQTSTGLRDLFISFQGGLLGLSKTIQREYGKRGIKANCLSLDFNSIDLQEIIEAINFSERNFGTAGHLFNLNLAKSL